MSESKNNEVLLQVDGMTCGSCARHVGDALRSVDGVCEVEVRLRERKVLVRHEGQARPEGLISALREAGYESTAA